MLQSAVCASRALPRDPPKSFANLIQRGLWPVRSEFCTLDSGLSTVNSQPRLFGLPVRPSPLECALAKNASVSLVESALTKSLDLKSFRIRTYKKHVGVSPLAALSAGSRASPKTGSGPAQTSKRRDSGLVHLAQPGMAVAQGGLNRWVRMDQPLSSKSCGITAISCVMASYR